MTKKQDNSTNLFDEYAQRMRNTAGGDWENSVQDGDVSEVFYDRATLLKSKKTMVMPQLTVRNNCFLPAICASFECKDSLSNNAAAQAFANNGLVFVATLVSEDELVDLDNFIHTQPLTHTVLPCAVSPYKDSNFTMLHTGVIAQVLSLQMDEDNNSTRVLLQGLVRAELLEIQSDDNLDLVKIKVLNDNTNLSQLKLPIYNGQTGFTLTAGSKLKKSDLQAVRDVLNLYFHKWLMENRNRDDAAKIIGNEEQMPLATYVDYIAEQVPLFPRERLFCLIMRNLLLRVYSIVDFIQRDLGLGLLRSQLDKKVGDMIKKEQRDYVIRNTIKALKQQLSDNTETDELDNYKKRLAELNLLPEVRRQLENVLQKIAKAAPNNPEVAGLQDYLDLVLSLPWGKLAPECFDLPKVQESLDANHFGLVKVKKRIVEYLAMRHLKEAKKNSAGTVELLCLIGPPGIGKTSIARSIAAALNRPLATISLGGVDDEAEIRGHRRTYIGAMPGRIIKALQTVDCDNPVILLDEIDKLGISSKGDPAAALLEVLDGEQNDKFRDNYVDLPYDLSKVLFIVTANSYDTIPPALYDRMDVINLDSYTENEKLQIAKRFLWPKLLRSINLEVNQIKLSDTCLRHIISAYTAEAGVRQLERCLKTICRKLAADLLLRDSAGTITDLPSLSIGKKDLVNYLGTAPYQDDELHRKDLVGVVNGLAWTYIGGVTLEVEVKICKGSGKINLTGNLGDVMKESATVAWTYIISQADTLKLSDTKWNELDVHIHIPEGATPKDGPSAGVTLATALYSALSGRKVKHKVAMTGELTLTGRVFPIGGLKEKLMAAYRAKMDTVIIPKANVKDLDEVDNEVKNVLHIVPVKQIEEVWQTALLP
jgi:hypothetical protein